MALQDRRCMEDCSNCSRLADGAPLSLEQMLEDGIEIMSEESSPEEVVIRKVMLEEMNKALEQLSPKDRTILIPIPPPSLAAQIVLKATSHSFALGSKIILRSYTTKHGRRSRINFFVKDSILISVSLIFQAQISGITNPYTKDCFNVLVELCDEAVNGFSYFYERSHCL